MFFPVNTKIWLHKQPIDFRKQIDGLIILVAGCLKLDPTSGHMFLFRNKSANKIKILCWERDGFWLLYKRLEKSKFKFPPKDNSHCELTSEQLSWLLSGVDITKQDLRSKITAKNFY